MAASILTDVDRTATIDPARKRPASLIAKGVWLLQHRRSHMLATLREKALFYWARWTRTLFPPPGVELAPNVRLQRNRCVMAEAPSATIVIGRDTIIYENAKIDAYGAGRIEIGEESSLGDIRIVSRYRVSVGRRFLSSWNVFIQDFDPHPTDAGLRKLQMIHKAQRFRPRFDPPAASAEDAWTRQAWNFPGAPIVIGDDVWICANATILKGARLGHGCIVAAGAVVMRGDYPDNSLIAGNPAKVIRTLPHTDTRDPSVTAVP